MTGGRKIACRNVMNSTQKNFHCINLRNRSGRTGICGRQDEIGAPSMRRSIELQLLEGIRAGEQLWWSRKAERRCPPSSSDIAQYRTVAKISGTTLIADNYPLHEIFFQHP